MTNELQTNEHIDRNTLDPSRFFQSFLSKAAELGLLENAEEIRRDTILLAAKMAQTYTFGASSSVTAETAQALLESAMCCIGRRLKTSGTGEALKLLKTLPAEKIWNEGKELLRRDLDEAKSLLSFLQEHTLNTENEAYRGTLFEALPSFFSAYDIEFAAHDTPCLIDYPLCVEPGRLAGVEYILDYLKKLITENSFCMKYVEQIEPLLRGYSPYWRDLNINIFELVLTNAVGRVMCGKEAAALDISEQDRERLKSSLNVSDVRLKLSVCVAAQRVCSELKLVKPLRDYMLKAVIHIVPRIKNALETGSLSSVLVTLKYEEDHAARFKDSAAMDDEAFRSVTEEIRSCRHVSDKLILIKQYIRSITDLTDMLGASCLYGNEYDSVFETLDNETLSLLYKQLPEDGAMHMTEGESEWHSALAGYLHRSGKTAGAADAAKDMEM